MADDLKIIYQLFISAGLDAFKDKQIPDWLAENPEIKKRKTVKKVFPVFGLSNFKEKVKYEITNEPYDIIQDLLEDIIKHLNNVKNKIYNKIKPNTDPVFIEIATQYLQTLSDTIEAVKNATINNENKLKIFFPWEVKLFTKTIFKPSDSIFTTFDKINKLNEQFSKKYPDILNSNDFKLPNIDHLSSAKKFNKLNLPKDKDYFIIFSGSGDEGVWDIATMSQRGIQSCQSWSGEHKECLIGSILSRYVGIIYLTADSETEYGSRMIKRCIVRFGINSKTNEKVIILDHMYDTWDPNIANLFVEALQRRTPLRVLDYSNTVIGESSESLINIPPERILKNLKPGEQPYKDIPFLSKHDTDESHLTLEDFLDIAHFDIYRELSRINKNQEIFKQTYILLYEYLKKLINYHIKQQTGYEFAKRMIILKMEQYFDVCYDLDIQSIFNKLFPHWRHLTIEEQLEKLNKLTSTQHNFTISNVRDKFEHAVRNFKLKFEKEFKLL